MAFEVVFAASAVRDLDDLEAYIAKDSPAAAVAFVDRLQARCRDLSAFPRRGVQRDDLAQGTRMLVVQRRTVILYRIDGATVLILGIVHAGRDLSTFGQDGVEDGDGDVMDPRTT